MKKYFIKLMCVLLLAAFILVLSACGGSSLVGRWECDGEILHFTSEGEIFQSFRSGSASFSSTYAVDSNNVTIAGGRLGAGSGWGGSWNFNVSGDTLTLENDRTVRTLTRVR
ncbi:MAG: hypothetical protein LBC71_07160 [Oscillospiraceae bacterium]|nr:hypothetical protein [Oscillospiraceae bacterium]